MIICFLRAKVFRPLRDANPLPAARSVPDNDNRSAFRHRRSSAAFFLPPMRVAAAGPVVMTRLERSFARLARRKQTLRAASAASA